MDLLLRTLPLCVALLAGLLSACSRDDVAVEQTLFLRTVVDQRGPADPWGKSVGDLNGDGRADLVVGGHERGGLVWYENPAWGKHVIRPEGEFSTDHEVGDIDNDGHNDIVSLMGDQVVWFRNGGHDNWTLVEIDRQKLHDIEIADFDGDGRLDIVGRGQTLFGGVGHTLHLYYQRPTGWERKEVEIPSGEGLKVADVDRDGRPDMIINGHWLKNPGGSTNAWRLLRITSSWTWPHVTIDVGDVNGDGRLDIVMAPAEPAGQRHRISWFEAPDDPAGEWSEHVIEDGVESAHHFVGVADFDRDGRLDVASALMHQARSPAEIKVYLNHGGGKGWSKRVLATTGSHNMRIIDFDGDGDPDLFGANWAGKNQHVELWINQTCSPAAGCPCWRRHVIDSQRPGKAVFVQSGDLDGDGLPDVAAGGYWYRNPGWSGGRWERHAFSEPAHDVVLLADLDRDGDTDAVATRWREDEEDARFVFVENKGSGQFALRTDLPSGAGDFLQGRALGRFSTGSGLLEIALSWHASDRGIEMLTVPVNPATDPWRLERIFPLSQDEALSAGDIDRDGRLDLLLGTVWLRNEGTSWRALAVDPARTKPDRNRLADINGDGCLDAVVGFEAISQPGDVVWYEQGTDVRQPWHRHHIGTVIGPMSLDVADFDGDGDLDIIVGEHNLKNPSTARLVLFENENGRGTRWREQIVHTGDEHHDGAIAVDIDGDGDADVISVGWGHSKVLFYENLELVCRSVAPNAVR